jgi:subtilisin family serine protease
MSSTNHWRRRLTILGLLVLLTGASASAQELSNQFLRNTKDPAEAKFDGALRRVYAAWKANASGQLSPQALSALVNEAARAHRLAARGDRIEVWIRFDPVLFDENALTALGIAQDDRYLRVGQDHLQALVPIASLEALRQLPSIVQISLPPTPVPLVLSEGVARVNAQSLTSSGYTGAGIKVAILDLGFSGYASKVGTELPSNVIVKSFYNSVNGNGDITGGGEIHGTACAEIVYDMAPGATMYLVNYNSLAEMNAAVSYLIAQGVKVISHSVGWFNTSFYDGTGPVSNVVATARSNGILWVNAAGNYAQRHWDGFFSDPDGNSINNFSGSDETINVSVTAGSTIEAFLTWNDWPGSSNDYDLFLHFGSQVVASSEGVQNGTQEPTEAISYVAPQSGVYQISISKASGSGSPKLELFVPGQDLNEYRVTSTSLIDPAPSTDALTAAAMQYNLNTIESFSSQGPANNGAIKPDITAPDGVSTSTYGTRAFFGTSAATPHTAGAAALLWSKKPSQTAADVRFALQAGAIDFGTAGQDNVYGYGLLTLCNVLPAATALSPSGLISNSRPTFTWTSIPGAQSYYSYLVPTADVYLPPGQSPTPLGPFATTSFTPAANLTQSDYAWVVFGFNQACGFSPFSPANYFTIGAACPLTTPVLTSPSGSASNPVQFTWSPVSGSTLYLVYVVDSSNNVVLQKLVTGTSFTASSSLPTGPYFWAVYAYNSSCGASPPASLTFSLP